MLKVLIIEDETGIRTIIKKYLSKFDITCIEAENGKKDDKGQEFVWINFDINNQLNK